MSDTSKARACRFLEFLQSTYGATRGQKRNVRDLIDFHGSEAVKQMLFPPGSSASDAEIEAALTDPFQDVDPPTAYENPVNYSILQTLVSDIEESIRVAGYQLTDTPVFGTLPTGRANAVTISVPPHNDKLVIFERGMFGLANLLAKVVARCFPITSGPKGEQLFSAEAEDIKEAIDGNPSITQRFSESLEAYLFWGDPHMATPYLLEPPWDHFAAILRKGLELFVMGHEFAHVLLGHTVPKGKTVRKGKSVHLYTDLIKSAYKVALTDKGENALRAIAEDVEASEVIYSFEMELAADLLGTELAMAAMARRGFDLSLSFAGVNLFFSYVDIIHRAASVIETGEVTERLSKSHPPPRARRHVVRNTFGQAFSKAFSEETSARALMFSKILEDIVENLWVRTLPQLQAQRKRGRQLTLSWSKPL